jgi:hypothetical protein
MDELHQTVIISKVGKNHILKNRAINAFGFSKFKISINLK